MKKSILFISALSIIAISAGLIYAQGSTNMPLNQAYAVGKQISFDNNIEFSTGPNPGDEAYQGNFTIAANEIRSEIQGSIGGQNRYDTNAGANFRAVDDVFLSVSSKACEKENPSIDFYVGLNNITSFQISFGSNGDNPHLSVTAFDENNEILGWKSDFDCYGNTDNIINVSASELTTEHIIRRICINVSTQGNSASANSIYIKYIYVNWSC